MGPSLTVSEINGDFGRKPEIFSYLHLFITPARRVPFEFCNGGSPKIQDHVHPRWWNWRAFA